MKKLLLAVTLLLAFNANAKLTINGCKNLEEIAGVIMEVRQGGASMREMIEAADGDELAEILIVEAFDVPLMSSESGKNKKVEQFKNSVFKMCFKSISEKI